MPGTLLRVAPRGLEESLTSQLNAPNYEQPGESPYVIVCMCNALGERQICAQRDRGVATARDVFKELQCEPRCATCVPEIEDILSAKAFLPAYQSSSNSPAADCR